MLKNKIKNYYKNIYLKFIYIFSVLIFYFRDDEIKSKSLLIVKLDAIGDYILFHNFLEELRKSDIYKDYHITLLGNCNVKNLAENLDQNFVDEFIWINKKYAYRNPWHLFRLINDIYKKFNVVIQATYSREIIGDLFVKLAGNDLKIGFKGDCNNLSSKEKNITDRWYSKLVDVGSDINFEFYKNKNFFSQILDRNISLIKPFINLIKIPVLNKIVLPKYFVVLFPGASKSSKQWPVYNFKLIADFLIQKFNLDIVICGCGQDSILAKKIIENHSSIIDLTGKTSLIELTQVISQSKLVISNDTSGAHIGAALDIPTIVLSRFNHYGRFVPYPEEISDNMICLTPHLFENLSHEELIEKFKFGSNEDISLIPVKDVEAAINKLLNI